MKITVTMDNYGISVMSLAEVVEQMMHNRLDYGEYVGSFNYDDGCFDVEVRVCDRSDPRIDVYEVRHEEFSINDVVEEFVHPMFVRLAEMDGETVLLCFE